jgi:holo-[acyl-carrier protein] synthase
MKIIGIGTDCVEVSRFDDLDNNFLKKVFTQDEIKDCMPSEKRSQKLAGRFAAKEAIMKAAGSVFPRLAFKKIEIRNTRSGAPVATIKGKDMSGYTLMISISHTTEIATSFALLAKK